MIYLCHQIKWILDIEISFDQFDWFKWMNLFFCFSYVQSIIMVSGEWWVVTDVFWFLMYHHLIFFSSIILLSFLANNIIRIITNKSRDLTDASTVVSWYIILHTGECQNRSWHTINKLTLTHNTSHKHCIIPYYSKWNTLAWIDLNSWLMIEWYIWWYDVI